jgi:2-keto-4-pentenoate hydratase
MALAHLSRLTAAVMASEDHALKGYEQRRLARDLIAAAREGRPIPPLSEREPGLTVADGGAIRDMVLAHRLTFGERLLGAKASLAGDPRKPAPALGWITDEMLLPGGVVNSGELIRPRVEPRLALLVDRRVREPMETTADLLAATAMAYPALEVVDSRYDGHDASLADHVADNCATAKVLIGEGVAPPAEGTLRRLRIDLDLDGAAGGADVDDAVSPGMSALDACLWLANELGASRQRVAPWALLLAPAGTASAELWPGVRVRSRDSELGSLELWA